jgi:sulfite exporter TauE/SafE
MVVPLLVTGLLGSFHCIGMCGGFVLALDRPGRVPWRRLAVQALFHSGKGCTYVVLGGLVGLLGASLVRAPWFAASQVALAIAAGVLMALAGLQLLGLLRGLPLGALFGPFSPYGRAVRSVTNLRGPLSPFLLGSLTGLLPCPLVYAFLAFAASTGSVLPAMGVMALLALCSAPALVLVGLGGALVAPHARGRLVRLAGAVVFVLGVVTVLRGAWPDALHAHVH